MLAGDNEQQQRLEQALMTPDTDTTPNPEEDKDLQLFRKLGLNPQQTAVLAGDNEQQQRLEQALMTPDTDEYYNAAAL